MARPSVRPKLVESALDRFHALGYHNCSVDDITRAAEVPKGSFYNHFASKDAIAVEALHLYQSRSVWRSGADAGDPPLAQLRHRFSVHSSALAKHGFTRGCLIGNMATELGDLSPSVRAEVEASLAFRSAEATRLLVAARDAGDVPADVDPDVLGPFLVNAWEGVVARTKVDKSTAATDQFFAVFDRLLGGAA